MSFRTSLTSTMAKSKALLSTFFISLSLALIFSTLVTATYYQSVSPTILGFREEKFTHLHFYFHDVFIGPNRTVVEVAEPLGKRIDSIPFGTVVAMEDPLTVGPDPDSKLVGKAQGLYVSISQEEMGLLMVMTLAFTVGEFDGSTLSVLSRNMIVREPVREMAIVGGTGAFRFVRGFAEAKFYGPVDLTVVGNAIVEYDIYVFHY